MRCDACGRFTRHLNDVLDFRVGGVEREVCDDCYTITRRDEKDKP